MQLHRYTVAIYPIIGTGNYLDPRSQHDYYMYVWQYVTWELSNLVTLNSE